MLIERGRRRIRQRSIIPRHKSLRVRGDKILRHPAVLEHTLLSHEAQVAVAAAAGGGVAISR